MAIDPNRNMKECSICGKVKGRDEYYANKSNRDGMSSMCKTCQGLYSVIRLIVNKDKDALEKDLEEAFVKVRRIKRAIEGASVAELVREESK